MYVQHHVHSPASYVWQLLHLNIVRFFFQINIKHERWAGGSSVDQMDEDFDVMLLQGGRWGGRGAS